MDDRAFDFLSARQERKPSALENRIDDLRDKIRASSPMACASKTGSLFSETGTGQGEFHLVYWDSPVKISFPELKARNIDGQLLPILHQGMLMYYFAYASGFPRSGRWVSYADLPGGRLYSKAFQGNSGDELARLFKLDVRQFANACIKAGGMPLEFSEIAYGFNALPHIPLAMTYHVGDEDFPSSCHILFDSTATNYLPIDVCAILAGMLTSRIERIHNSLRNE
jgi:Domain of unknown function (DUF3786)